MRLIDADELSERMWRTVLSTREDIDFVIKTAPTVDAVEVVRCKDCIHSGQCTKEIVMRMRVGSYLYCPMGNEGFCSHGERKEDE